MPSSCAVLGGFVIGAQISLLRQHSPNAKSQQVLCTLSMPRVHWQPWLFLGCFYKCSAAAEMGVVWPQDMAENWGLCPFWEEGDGSPRTTMRIGPRPTFIPSGILIHTAVWPHQIWAEIWGAVPLGAGAVSASTTMLPGPRPTIVPSGILIHPTVWPQQRKFGSGDVPPFLGEGELGPQLTQCRLGRGLPPYQVAS